ncbi:hypothetical protein EVAR_94596_1 [Eumeta japonica]|uniref:Uncharacterized protein n=1 Tax=Eumeta variegata TaxID=151549 RepID=A0A4C1UUU8_EUMVA|nr:hypothetical protein EVAR_94596_1 [Eumeta japonica]
MDPKADKYVNGINERMKADRQNKFVQRMEDKYDGTVGGPRTSYYRSGLKHIKEALNFEHPTGASGGSRGMQSSSITCTALPLILYWSLSMLDLAYPLARRLDSLMSTINLNREDWETRCRNSDVRERCGVKEDVVTGGERGVWRWSGLWRGSEPRVECTKDTMKVTVPMDGDRKLTYLDQMRGISMKLGTLIFRMITLDKFKDEPDRPVSLEVTAK